MKIHVCLVSAQAAANLLPALDPSLKPEKVILVVSAKMKPQAESLAAVFKEVGVRVERCALEDEHDYRKIEDSLLRLAEQYPEDDVILNATGGTKLMSLVAQSVASAAGWRMFYVDADTDLVTWLGAGALTVHRLSEQLRLRHYLLGYGYTLSNPPARPQLPADKNRLIETLILQIGSLEQAIAQLNWLAQQAEDRQRLDIDMTPNQLDSRSLDALLRHFEEAGCINVNGARITFPDQEQRDFVKGGWLEAHVFQTINALSGKLQIRDKAMNLEVTNTAGVKSELDVAFMARNRLFIIECKTARMDKPEAPKANDSLFKLAENSRRIGGLGTRAMLVSYRALRDHEKKLAKALNVELVCGQDILQLKDRVTHWVGG